MFAAKAIFYVDIVGCFSAFLNYIYTLLFQYLFDLFFMITSNHTFNPVQTTTSITNTNVLFHPECTVTKVNAQRLADISWIVMSA